MKVKRPLRFGHGQAGRGTSMGKGPKYAPSLIAGTPTREQIAREFWHCPHGSDNTCCIECKACAASGGRKGAK